MMDYKEFMEKAAAALQEKLGEKYHVQIKKMVKNNDVTQTALVVESPQSNASPCIYLEGFYLDYQTGDKTFPELVDEMEAVYRGNAVAKPFDTSFFTEYSNVNGRLRGKLVNTEMNHDFLETVPHREYLDLSLVYIVSVPEGFFNCSGNVQVRNEHMRMWGVTEQELYETVITNMEHDTTELKSMEDIMTEFTGGVIGSRADDAPALYVAGNTNRVNGAVEMLNRKFLMDSADFFGADFMILPSSIHELLFLPVSGMEDDSASLAQIVRAVNDTQVRNDEILSYHVYRYSRNSGEVAIAA